MDKKTLHLIPHTHWDREWYMGFERHRMRLVELFDCLINLMEKNPEYTYYHLDGQFIVIEDYLEIRPEMRARLLKLVKADRIQIGPWYVLQDEYLTSGEANVRNMLYGIKLCREFGAEPVMSGYFPDSFGNISQVPQILKGFGIDSAIFGRGIGTVAYNNKVSENANPSEWLWSAPDGSEVLGVMFSHWYHNAMQLPSECEALKQQLTDLIAACEGSAATPHLLGMNGCDHQPVQTNLPEIIKTANEIFGRQGITVRQSNFKDYIKAVKPYAHKFPKIEGELTCQTTSGWGSLIGTASTHIPLKQRNHQVQNLLEHQAEPLNVLSCLSGDEYREGMLLFAWKKLMENHPHDSICCCSSDEVTDEMVSRFERARQVGEFVRDEAISNIKKNIKADKKGVLVLHTSAGRTRTTVKANLDYPEGKKLEAVCLIAPDGTKIPASVKPLGRTFTFTLPKDSFREFKYVDRFEITFPVDVSGVGYSLYTVKEENANANIKVWANGAETDTLRLEVAKNGSLTVTDKKSGASYSGLNTFEDVGDAGESYNFKFLDGDKPITSEKCRAKISVFDKTAFSVTFKIEVKMDLPKTTDGNKRSKERVATAIKSFVTLTAGVDRVDIKTVFNNQSENHRLRAMFKPEIKTDVNFADGQFDLVKRDNVPHKNWENPSNTGRCQAFFALEDNDKGLAVGGKGLHEYEVLPKENNTMALTLLRAVGFIGDWGIFPTPKMQCKGELTAEYTIVPYGKEQRCEAHELARNFAFEDVLAADVDENENGTSPANKTLVCVDNAAIVTSALKRSEDGKYKVLRLYNPTDKAVDFTLKLCGCVKKLFNCNLAEEKGEEIKIENGEAKITAPPKKILTFLMK